MRGETSPAECGPLVCPPAPVAVSVILPAHNEAVLLEDVVTDIVNGLRSWGRTFEIRVMENGSSDATAEIADALSRAFPEVRPHALPSANHGNAVREGFLKSEGDIAVLFDVDYYDLPFLTTAVSLLEGSEGQRAAIVLGSKARVGRS